MFVCLHFRLQSKGTEHEVDAGCIYLGSSAVLLMCDRKSLQWEVDIWSHHIRLDSTCS